MLETIKTYRNGKVYVALFSPKKRTIVATSTFAARGSAYAIQRWVEVQILF